MRLNWGTMQNGFKFHWRVKESKVSHLFFADDILMFCHGNVQSVNIINFCIQSLSLYSRLIPNAQKSQCFMANVDSETAQLILSSVGFIVGSLPIRFLGVPLISTKLSYQDCLPVIHRTTKRAASWTSIALSYVGKLQLIKSVRSAMSSFWCRHFMFPKSVIRCVQSILGRFLWKGPSLAKFGAKALPVKEGGLGMKNLLEWNKSLIMMHLINVIKFEPTSFWAKWVQAVVLKRRNLWQITIPTDCSWIWRQVLKLRPTTMLYI